MVSKKDIARFWSNYDYFTGDSDRHDPPTKLLFDCIPFRMYLNDFFGNSARVENYDAGPHWVVDVPTAGPRGRFKRGGGTLVVDSYEDRSQPDFDYHCTLYSLYNQAYHSECGFRSLLRLQPLYRSSSLTWYDYLDNLIMIYTMLQDLLILPAFTSYVYAFPDWRDYGEHLKNLPARAKFNVSILKKLRKGGTTLPSKPLFT